MGGLVVNAQHLINVLMSHLMAQHLEDHRPRMIGDEPGRQAERTLLTLPAPKPTAGVIQTKRRGPHGPLKLTVVDVRPPSGKLPQEGGIHALLAVLGAGTLVLFEGIADTIAAPVAAWRRGVRAVPWAELRVLLLSVVALAVAARDLLLAGGKLTLTWGRWSDLWRRLCTLTERRRTLRGPTVYGWSTVSWRVAIWRDFTWSACGILGARC